MVSKRNDSLCLLGIACSAVFLTQLGNPLAGGHSDEPLYIGIAREMYAKHEWILPLYHGAPAFYKPPLLYWLMMASFKVFGNTLFAARLPSALFGIAAVLLVAKLGERLFGERGRPAGWITLTTIPGVYAYARAALMDIPLVFFITLSIYLAVLAENGDCLGDRSRRDLSPTFQGLSPFSASKSNGWALAGSFISMGIAGLLKGPVGILIPLVPILFLAYHKKIVLRGPQTFFGILIGLAIVLFWPFMLMLRGYGCSWLHFFILQENFGKFSNQFDPTTHPTPGSVVWIHLFSQFLPWSFLLLAAFILFLRKREAREGFYPLLILWILTVVGVFLLPEKKLSHYTLPAIPPSALLVAGLVPANASQLLTRISFYLTGVIFLVAGFLLFLVSRISNGTFDLLILLGASACFLLAGMGSLKRNFSWAALGTSGALFLYALGLPHLMSTLNLSQFRKAAEGRTACAYKIDTGILGAWLNKEIVPVDDLKSFNFANGLLIIRDQDQIDLLKNQIKLSSPIIKWDSWKDHIRILDILQAAIAGDPHLIREKIMAVKLW